MKRVHGKLAEAIIQQLDKIDIEERNQVERLHIKQQMLHGQEQMKLKQDHSNPIMKFFTKGKKIDLEPLRKEVDKDERELNDRRKDFKNQRRELLSDISLDDLKNLEQVRENSITEQTKKLESLDKDSSNHSILKEHLEQNNRNLLQIKSEILIATDELQKITKENTQKKSFGACLQKAQTQSHKRNRANGEQKKETRGKEGIQK